MAGEIKAGRGTLIGNAGEHYVVAELLKRGAVAALVPRNTPSIDILASQGSKTARVRVKTKSEQYTDWQWVIKKDGTIFRDLGNAGDFIVLVDLAVETKNMKYYVVPTIQVDKWLKQDHDHWLRTPGKKGQKHSTENTKRHINFKKRGQSLEPYLNAWESIWS